MIYSDVLDAYDKGRYHIAPYRKSRSLGFSGTDLSYGAGTPMANYYASAPMVQATLPTNEGIFHGVTTNDKYLHKITVHQITGSIGQLELLDYVAYIPFIDGDSIDEQIPTTFDLPRFKDGQGIQAMVISQGQGISAGVLTVVYTNSTGQTGRISNTYINGAVGAGYHALDRNVFIELQAGDSGISKIESIQFNTSIGGIYALVLVKQIVTVAIREAASPLEYDYFKENMSMPKVHKDAYLNFLFKYNATIVANIQAQLEFIW